jgi:nitrate reductase NapE component
MEFTHVAEFVRLMLYPLLTLGLVNAYGHMRQGGFMFLSLSLWVLSLALVNFTLIANPFWTDPVRAYVSTPLLALAIFGVWRQLWKSSRKVNHAKKE